ncbi:hypothetical protein SAMN05421858_3480 [Haladaptatus litoreus]|uniref:Uncharacterized protein n=2 Tax=Haladaptatus litoreus TaxID=553468 RepID=A0A1N7DAZ1_9EURY|nr:hypothetical protein SAMN05421858_3480 [Haladaptatus litoreus]
MMHGAVMTGFGGDATTSQTQNGDSTSNQIKITCEHITFFTHNFTGGPLLPGKTVLVFVMFADESQIEVKTTVDENGVGRVDLPGNRTVETVTLVYEEGEDLLITEFLNNCERE